VPSLLFRKRSNKRKGTHGVLSHVEGNLDVGLSGQVVDLGRLNGGDDGDEVGGVGQVCRSEKRAGSVSRKREERGGKENVPP
jgi:hypothetical protein